MLTKFSAWIRPAFRHSCNRLIIPLQTRWHIGLSQTCANLVFGTPCNVPDSTPCCSWLQRTPKKSLRSKILEAHNVVFLRTGMPSTTRPKAHCGTLMEMTRPDSQMRLKHSRWNNPLPAGFSNTKCLLASSCNRTTRAANAANSSPTRRVSLHVAGCRTRFKWDQDPKDVQGRGKNHNEWFVIRKVLDHKSLVCSLC